MMRKKGSGFTLIEVVVALFLGGLILTSIMSLLVGFLYAWENKKTPYELFVQHVDACMRFLDKELNTFVPIYQGKSVEYEAYQPVKLSFKNKSEQNIFAFGGLKQTPLFFVEDNACIAWRILFLSPEGLCLAIETPETVAKRLQEGVEATGKTVQQCFILSPYVNKLEYGILNEDRNTWEFATTIEQYAKLFPKKTDIGRPHGLRVTFKQEDWELTRFISLKTIKKTDDKKLQRKVPHAQ